MSYDECQRCEHPTHTGQCKVRLDATGERCHCGEPPVDFDAWASDLTIPDLVEQLREMTPTTPRSAALIRAAANTLAAVAARPVAVQDIREREPSPEAADMISAMYEQVLGNRPGGEQPWWVRWPTMTEQERYDLRDFAVLENRQDRDDSWTWGDQTVHDPCTWNPDSPLEMLLSYAAAGDFYPLADALRRVLDRSETPPDA